VAEASTAAEAVQMTGNLHPDIVLMDIRLPDQSGVVTCRQIRKEWPSVQVLMLTSFADEELVIEAIEAGAAGYILKQLDTDELLRAVRAVARGDAVLDPAVTRKVLDSVRQAKEEGQAAAFKMLSDREVQVLVLLAEGKTNPEIAEVLFLSEKTVRNHVSEILGKLELTNRIEAATYAVRHNIERYVSDWRDV
jgi:DNA-binding NarL/FixJ family response regulator